MANIMVPGTSIVMLLCTCIAVVSSEVPKESDKNTKSLESATVTLIPVIETEHLTSKLQKKYRNFSSIFLADLLKALAEASKRNYKIVHFGRRATTEESTNEGHQLLHFGKRDESNQSIKVMTDTAKSNGYRKSGRVPGGIKHSGIAPYEPRIHFRFLLNQLENRPYERLLPEGLKQNSEHKIMLFGKRSDQTNVSPPSVSEFEDVYHTSSSDKPENVIESFRKRPSGHNIISFGKRLLKNEDVSSDETQEGHKILSFGKNSDDEEKREGHKILSFGKRSDDEEKWEGHKILSFGKRSDDEEKWEGHKILSFGKKADDEEKHEGHKILSFGKKSDDEGKHEGHKILSFGKKSDDDEKQEGHKMLYFGKKSEENQGNKYNILHFVKKLEEENNARGHKVLSFGKKSKIQEKNDGRKIIYFGKKLTVEDPTHGYQIISFGKRFHSDVFYHSNCIDSVKELTPTVNQTKDKRNAHPVIHFGKRSVNFGDFRVFPKNAGTFAINPEKGGKSFVLQPLEISPGDAASETGSTSFQGAEAGKKHRQKRSVDSIENLNLIVLKYLSPHHELLLPTIQQLPALEGDLRTSNLRDFPFFTDGDKLTKEVENGIDEKWPNLWASLTPPYYRQDRGNPNPTPRKINKNVFLHFG
ncbi:uncharacterized protein LOC143239458 [Tachypleus tridentatus]|uniref:uncharacterized protein LOC143239458 n=1 Tax=Tachypleus tridentatus TaxID=6853 RepID=UPI003FD6B019